MTKQTVDELVNTYQELKREIDELHLEQPAYVIYIPYDEWEELYIRVFAPHRFTTLTLLLCLLTILISLVPK